jgi:hypothetical protein
MNIRLLRCCRALGTVAADGCAHAYHPMPVAKVLRGEIPRLVRVTRQEGSRVVPHEAILDGDTLVGWNEPAETLRVERHIVRVPVSLIREIGVREVDSLGSAGAWGGAFLDFLLAAGALVAGMDSLSFGS